MTLDEVLAVYRTQLAAVRQREIMAGMTLLGPHRDELRFRVQGRDLRTYGSRGQQRTATLALKLAEFEVMRDVTGEPPVLLLDDVMSELDAQRRAMLLHALEGVDQAIVTTTDWNDFTPEFRAHARCLTVTEGRMHEVPGEDG
jgi:DNA replication and repair protein RecF